MTEATSELGANERLDQYFDEVYATILSRQDANTGLFPASTDVNGHGDYTDAWVRDNVYSVQAVWGLWLGYRRSNHNPGRTEYLGDCVTRLMRGLLNSMLRQSHKVERFKYTQNPMDALHAKYGTQSGDVVVDDDKWGHLQLDATSIFLLMLAQMTRSGLRLIHTVDEVNFVQNLVWYIGRGYRTPDYGIWERGNKINNGHVEINASSVGMVKAALQAMRGLNLLHDAHSYRGVIHVVPDEIARCRTTLENLLPRESLSKEVDAACLSVIGYPAFAVEKKSLVNTTREHILDKLAGRYGCKRFLLDGHQTVLEDHNRLHYEPEELRNFENIESEWPLFFAFLYLDALFAGDMKCSDDYRKKLDELRVEKDGLLLLPELYYVDQDHIDAERADPGSQPRVANANVPLVWTQSLYVLGCLVHEGLVTTDELDPVAAHQRIGRKQRSPVLVGLLAENDSVKDRLAARGLWSETVDQLDPVRVLPPLELARVFNVVGQNRTLGLTGRPQRRPRSLATAQLYQLGGESCVFLPQFQNRDTFYLASDNRLLCEKVQAELKYISRHWNQDKQPLMMLYLTETMTSAMDADAVFDLVAELTGGTCNGVTVRTGPLLKLLDDVGTERIDDLNDYYVPDALSLVRLRRKNWLPNADHCQPSQPTALSLLEPAESLEQQRYRLQQSTNLREQMDIVTDWAQVHGLDFEPGLGPRVTVKVLLEEVYRKAGCRHEWSVLRKAAGVLGKYWGGLEDSVAEILARQRIINVGRAYSDQGLIRMPLSNRDTLALIRQNCGADVREAILNQEILVILSVIMRGEPELFDGMMTIRPGHLAQLMMGRFALEAALEPDQAFERLAAMSPFDIQTRIRDILESYTEEVGRLFSTEALHLRSVPGVLHRADTSLAGLSAAALDSEVTDWHTWREEQGVMPRFAESFHQRLWSVLQQCPGIVLGDRFDPHSRLQSDLVTSHMTGGEPQFAQLVERLLSHIESPAYRQMSVEALAALIAFAEANPALELNDFVILDVVISHAVRLSWQQDHAGQAEAY
ncbi:MAG: glycoside hydrolase family 15 protein, partial [Saccharospirillum sp.]|uniref:glycoside hydrolase family 15 protein n=1 Tax=Saccharospirillum sp. TaxID=2033801 RepID=UPI0034A0205B